MPLNITIDHASTAHGSEHSPSFSDDEESSTVHLSPASAVESHGYPDSLDDQDGWVLYPDEIGPSDSASHPRTSQHNRPIVEARPPPSRRLSSRRYDRPPQHQPHPRHRHQPIPPESVDPNDDYPGYGRGSHPPPGRQHGPWGGGPPAGYAASYASGPAYNPQYAPPPGHGTSLVPLPHGGYGYPQHPFSPGSTAGSGGYFSSHGNPLAPHHGQFGGSDIMPYSSGANQYYNQYPYGMPQGMGSQMYGVYPYSVMPQPGGDAAKDEGLARLEKIILDQKKEADEKEAKAIKAAEDKAAEEKKAAEEAATKAAEKKAADDAAKKAAGPPKEAKKGPIKFKDALNRKFTFPFRLCQTWAGMEDLIKQAFAHVEDIGPHVSQGHYDLVGPNGEIILPQVWETMIEPDWSITMKMWPLPEPPKPPEIPGLDGGPMFAPEGFPFFPGGGPFGPPPPGSGPPKSSSGKPIIVDSKNHLPPPPPPGGPLPTLQLVNGQLVPVPSSTPAPSKKAPPPKVTPLLRWVGSSATKSKPSGKDPRKTDKTVQHDIICRVM